jgi:hypothetical protein
MNSHTKIILLLIVHCSLLIALTSCKKEQGYSIIPDIQFQGYSLLSDASGIDTTLILTLSFTDGDGDIGLSQSDTLPPFNIKSQYYYDFFTDFYERQYGILTLKHLNPPYNFRLPLITIMGSNKNIKGTILVNYSFTKNGYTSKFDTIALQVYIVDRDLHKSNVIMTPDIILGN